MKGIELLMVKLFLQKSRRNARFWSTTRKSRSMIFVNEEDTPLTLYTHVDYLLLTNSSKTLADFKLDLSILHTSYSN